MGAVETFIVVGHRKRPLFVRVVAEADWVEDTGVKDPEKVAALAQVAAYNGLRLFKALGLEVKGKVGAIRLGKDMPKGAKEMFTPNVPQGVKQTGCYWCVCYEDGTCHCSKVPCSGYPTFYDPLPVMETAGL
jgi:hypothetical protein